MKKIAVILGFAFVLFSQYSFSSDVSETKKIFENAGQSGSFFKNSYGYAIFPTIAKGGFVLGGAFGKGQVYEQGKHIGSSDMSQLSLGFQLGAQGFSQIIFFQDKRSLNEFTNGNFEFAAKMEAVAITAAASASASTAGNSATASGGKNNANTIGEYNKGMAIFTVVKGGLMYEVSVAGQKFKFKAN